MQFFSKESDEVRRIRDENLREAWVIMDNKLSTLTRKGLTDALSQAKEDYAFPGLNNDSSLAGLVAGLGLVAVTQGASAIVLDQAAKAALPRKNQITDENCVRMFDAILAHPNVPTRLKACLIRRLMDEPKLKLNDEELLDGFRKPKEMANTKTATRFHQKL